MFQYSLRTLFELTTITALLLGVGVMSPWLGIVLAVLITPGVVRFCYCDVRTTVRGKQLYGVRRLRLLLIDIGIGAYIAGASIAISFAVFTRCVENPKTVGLLLFIVGITVAIAAGIATFSYMSWYFWFRAPE